MKEKIAEDFSLNSDHSDSDHSNYEEDKISFVPNVKRGPSSPVEASPSKVYKQSGSRSPGQQVDEGSVIPPDEKLERQ